MGHAGRAGVESLYRQKGRVMFETAADNSSIAAPTVEAEVVLSSATTAAAWAERLESSAALLTEHAEPSSCEADCARAATTLRTLLSKSCAS